MSVLNTLAIKTHEPIINNIERPGAERNVLAYILNDSDAIYDVISRLKDDDFNNSLNQLIFKCMTGLSERGVRVTLENILAVTKSKDILGQDGEEYLRRIARTDTSAVDLKYNIEQVLVASLKRKAYLQGIHVLNDCVDERSYFNDVNEFVGRQQQRFMDLGTGTSDSIVLLGEDVDKWLKQRSESPNPVPGLHTGFEELDKAIGGFMPGRLYVFAGRSKARKSILLNNFATYMSAVQGKPILYLDTEMLSFEDVRPRILAILSGVSERDINTGMYVNSDSDRESVNRAARILAETPFHHAYVPNFNISSIVSLIRKCKVKHDIQAIFFDYIKMPMSQHIGALKEYQLLGLLTASLKDIAGELRIPGITACQLNREALKGDEPDEFSIGASDRILHNASYLFYLWKKTPEQILEDGGIDSGNTVLSLGASRHGGEYRAFLRAHESNARMWEVVRV
ncbi:MAG TPA: hypothetical protein GXX72_00065 [Clostridiaceae bacterium]|nr:hypothetical protein [Clostridiaceae bacterium]